MEYLKPKFSLPAGPRNISQEEWDRIFGRTYETSSGGTISPEDVLSTEQAYERGLKLSQEGWRSDGSMPPHIPDGR